MAKEIVNRQLNIYVSSGEAGKALDVLVKKEKELNAELAKTSDPARMAKLRGELDKLREPMDRLKKKVSGELTPSFRDLEAGVRKFLNEFKKTGSPEALANFKKFQSELNKMKAEINSLEEGQKGFGKSGFFSAAFWANLAAGGVAAAASAMSGFFSSSIEEALDADAATSRLKSTLENLGRSDAFDRITRKADQMAQQFRYLDNDDIVGVFNKLIDYGKLTEQQMNDLLPVIIDFAAKSQIGIDESASVIIKALEGNGKALKEYGINIKDAGTETERMDMIMSVLKPKVEGAGQAFMDSAKGGLATMRQETANLKEEIGNGLIPMLNRLLSFTLSSVNNLKSFFNAIGAELKGNSGYIQIALDEVNDNPVLRQAVVDAADQTTKSVLGAQKQIEDQLGRKLNLKSKEDAEMLRNSQEIRIKGIEQSLKSDSDLLEKFIKSGRRDDQQQARDLKISILAKTKALDDLRLALNPNKDPLGIDPGGGYDKKNDELKKAIEERTKLLEELNKIQFNQTLVGIPQLEKDLKLMDKKYAELRTRAKGETEILIRIEQLYLTERIQLIDSYAEKEIEAWKKVQEKNMTEVDKQFVRNLKRLRDQADAVLNGENDGSVKRQTALTLQQQQDDEDAKNKRIDNLFSYFNQATAIFDTLSQMQTDRENAELAADQARNDQKRRNLENRLRMGTISQTQYQRELDKLDKEREKKEKEIAIKQFNRQKAANIAQALIDGAMAISLVYRTTPPVIPGTIIPNPQFPIALASAIAQRLATIALIASAKPPAFARGGKLGGNYHSDGGNNIVDGNGRVIGNIEKNEGIINRHTMGDRNSYSVTGTPSQIASTLNGLHGGRQWDMPARLVPAWSTRMPVPMNFAAINRYFAAGGKFDNSSNAGSAAGNSDQVLQMLAITMERLNVRLDYLEQHGIMAFTLVTENEKAQAKLDAIRDEATIKG